MLETWPFGESPPHYAVRMMHAQSLTDHVDGVARGHSRAASVRLHGGACD